MSFSVHTQLAQNGIHLGDLALCRVLLVNDSHFPWLILVPKRENLRELFDLSPDDYTTCMQEIRTVAEQFCAHTRADKMNVAALGNMVPQLHIHIIARFQKDAAWPSPVWNAALSPKPYDDSQIGALIAATRQSLGI